MNDKLRRMELKSRADVVLVLISMALTIAGCLMNMVSINDVAATEISWIVGLGYVLRCLGEALLFAFVFPDMFFDFCDFITKKFNFKKSVSAANE